MCFVKESCDKYDLDKNPFNIMIDSKWIGNFPANIDSIKGEELHFNDCDCTYNKFSCNENCGEYIYKYYSNKNIGFFMGDHKKIVLESNKIDNNGIFGLRLNAVIV